MAITTLSASAYGGTSYFDALLPALMDSAASFECTVVAKASMFGRYCRGRRDRRISLLPVSEGLTGGGRILWEQLYLPRLLQLLKIDVVYTAVNVGILRGGIPCVTAVRNMEPLVDPQAGVPFAKRMRCLLLRRMTLVSARRARRVVAVSNFVRETLVQKGVDPRKIDVIYHGIDDVPVFLRRNGSNEGTGKTNPFVFAAAKFVRYANLGTLFRAFAEMRGLGYSGELRFAGGSHDREYEAEIRNLVRELQIEDGVRFLGYIPRDEMQVQLSTCDLLLFPSVLEACPFTLLEGMRQGAAIVATMAPPMPEFCGNGAICVAPNDHRAMALAAWRIVSDRSLRATLTDRARARAAGFRWEKNVADLLDVLAAAAAGVR